MVVAATLDVETEKLAQDLPNGWADLRDGLGGISSLVVWPAITGRPHVYDAHNTLQQAVDLLESCNVCLTFNGMAFDIPVIEGVLGRRINVPYHFDLLRLIWDATPGGLHKGNKLGDVALRTLGLEKSGNATDVPELLRQGRIAEVVDYNISDVHLTRLLFQFVQKNGGVIGLDGNLLRLDMPPWFPEVLI